MKKVLFSIALVFLMVGVAFAANAHFIYSDAIILNDGKLSVNFKEAGLGDNELITYKVTAQATATYVSVNNGGKNPEAANKTSVEGPVEGFVTLSSGKNGHIAGTVTIMPLGPGTFEVPPGQILVLGDVSYSDITIVDTKYNVVTFIESFLSKIIANYR